MKRRDVFATRAYGMVIIEWDAFDAPGFRLDSVQAFLGAYPDETFAILLDHVDAVMAE